MLQNCKPLLFRLNCKSAQSSGAFLEGFRFQLREGARRHTHTHNVHACFIFPNGGLMANRNHSSLSSCGRMCFPLGSLYRNRKYSCSTPAPHCSFAAKLAIHLEWVDPFVDKIKHGKLCPIILAHVHVDIYSHLQSAIGLLPYGVAQGCKQ